MSEWMFTAEELGLVMADARIEPWGGSPLRRMPPVSADSDIEIAPQVTNEMLDAIRHVARPETVLGLVVYPPDKQETFWFYGRDSDYALFHETADGYRVISPLDEVQLLDVLIEPLDLIRPTSGFEFSLVADRSGLEALAAVVDIVQENSLLGFLHRNDPPELSFETADLLACWERGMASDDLKWMIHRASALSPVALAPSDEGLARGADALADQQALVVDNGRWRATPAFTMLCSMLGACNGLAALSTRTRIPGDGGWRLEHMAAARCGEGIWLFDFADISSSDFTLTVVDISGAELYSRLRAALTAGKVSREDDERYTGLDESPAPASMQVSNAEASCAVCGAAVTPGASFCSECGAPARRTVQQSFCTSCGATLEGGKRFCTSCGATVKGAKADVR